MDTSKIIKGVVNSGRYTVTAPIVKEDYGLYLQIEGVELPQTYQVDFSNDEHHGTSVTMIGNSDGVLIPHQFIDTGKDVFAFLYHVGANYGKTVYKFRIPNKCRPDRTDDTPTPEQASVIDQAISALNEAVEQTAQDVIDADQSARSAKEYAEQAESARTGAQNYATQAQTSANNASASASQASASASASAQSASEAEAARQATTSLVAEAQGYADASAQSASASANSASQAQGYAQSASASATNAQGYASNAQTSANTASSKATEASGYADTASAKATESAQSASQALSYKTDAESAKTASQTAQGLAESARDSAISAKDDAESARDEAQNIVDGISAKAEQIDSNTERIESLEDDRYKPYAVDSASGSIASFSDGADNLPLKSLVVDINPVQDLSHGDPSPENLCPISGWTEVDVEQRGKNIYNFEENKITTWNTTGGAVRACYPLGIKGCTLSFSAYQIDSSQVADMYINIGKLNNGTLEVFNSLITPNGVLNRTFTFSDDEEAVLMGSSASPLVLKNNLLKYRIQVEKNDSVSEYSPYTGRSITIQLGQTVYGGKLDVLTGELVIDRAMVDLGALSWTYNDTYNRFLTSALVAIIKPSDNTKKGNIVCSLYKKETANHTADPAYDNTIGVGSTGTIVIRDTSYTDATAFQAMLTANNAQLVYELAEPIEIQLSPNQVNSLLGVNNLWADSGDTTAEYRADTKLFIERLTAPDSADMIADANITSGQYFMVGNSLYKATANIANGAQIIVGTNAVRKSLSEALNEINA